MCSKDNKRTAESNGTGFCACNNNTATNRQNSALHLHKSETNEELETHLFSQGLERPEESTTCPLEMGGGGDTNFMDAVTVEKRL